MCQSSIGTLRSDTWPTSAHGVAWHFALGSVCGGPSVSDEIEWPAVPALVLHHPIAAPAPYLLIAAGNRSHLPTSALVPCSSLSAPHTPMAALAPRPQVAAPETPNPLIFVWGPARWLHRQPTGRFRQPRGRFWQPTARFRQPIGRFRQPIGRFWRPTE